MTVANRGLVRVSVDTRYVKMWAPTIVLNEVKQNPGQPMYFGRPSRGAPFHSLYNDRGAHLVPHFHPFCPELQHLWPFNSLYDTMKKLT